MNEQIPKLQRSPGPTGVKNILKITNWILMENGVDENPSTIISGQI